MSRSFGPWSTAIGTGAHPELNTFWKRRLAMLPMLGQTASRVSRRTVLLLGALAVVALAIPTLKWAGHDPLAGALAKGAAGPGDSSGGTAAASAENRDKPGASETTSNAFRTAEYLPRPSEEEQKFLEILAKKIDVDFLELPLEECVHRLGDETGLPFWFDRSTLTDEGVAMDQSITLKLKKCRVEAALNLLLTPVQLETVFENDVVVVTTSTKAGEKLITRTYPVSDLCPRIVPPENVKPPAAVGDAPAGGGAGGGGRLPGNSYASLMNAIETTVEPDSWEALSGPGTMQPVHQSRSLVIRQTLPVHRKILQLLRDLREAKGQADREKP
jgi:hypothetical protein